MIQAGLRLPLLYAGAEIRAAELVAEYVGT